MSDRRERDQASTVAGLASAVPEANALELAVARSRAEAALFGNATSVKVGRYTLIERAGAGAMGVVWSAWDPELGRGVALKLASSGDAAARARARDEGRALARLSHPNVVPIYDVLETDDGVFLVMELVAGKNLRAVVAGGATPAEVIRAYRQAGEGLAAAHRAGLVHRDFKPDNAILGADHRVRVLDFGLAHEVATSAAEVAGTPRYMAPEQRAGEPLTAAVDQYALCVALREGLGERVPGWIAPILARGTAERPDDRYPAMDDLLRALALDPRTRWRRRAAVTGAIVATGAVVVAFAIGRARREEAPCEGGPARLDTSWGPARHAAVAAHLGALASPYAAEGARRVLDGLDDYAGHWIAQYKGACLAHRRGELSATLYDRREACLANRSAALATLGELAGAETGDRIAQLVVAVGNLPALPPCEDDEALVANVAPLVPAQAKEAAAIDALIAKTDVEREAGRFDEAARDADAAVTRTTALGYSPLVARARLARGRVALSAHTADIGAGDFAESLHQALTAGDDPLAIEAYARRAWTIATNSNAATATDGVELVEALARHDGARYRFPRALLQLNLGGVAMAHGDRTAARDRFLHARDEAAGSPTGATELTAANYNLLLVSDDPAERTRIGNELVAARTRLLGEHHPLTLDARALVATLTDDPRTAATLLSAACRDFAKYHPEQRDDLVNAAYDLMWIAIGLDDRALAAEASAFVQSAADPTDLQGLVARAQAELARGDLAAMRTTLASPALAAGPDAPWWVRLFAADALAISALATHHTATIADLDRRYTALASSLPATVRARRAAIVALLKR